MNIKFDKYAKEDSISYLKKLEDAIKLATVINYNENMIEFPGLFILSKDNNGSLISKLLNPGVEIFEVSEDAYEEMYALVNQATEGVKVLKKTKTVPITKSRINLDKMRRDSIYIKNFEGSLVVNEVLFTTSEFEFHGTGLFTARKHVYLISLEELENLKTFFGE